MSKRTGPRLVITYECDGCRYREIDDYGAKCTEPSIVADTGVAQWLCGPSPFLSCPYLPRRLLAVYP